MPRQNAPTAGRHPPGYWRSLAGKALAVALGVATAMSLRGLLAPWLGLDSAPFVTAFPVVAAVAFFTGVGTGAVAAVGCALAGSAGASSSWQVRANWRSSVFWAAVVMAGAFIALEARAPMFEPISTVIMLVVHLASLGFFLTSNYFLEQAAFDIGGALNDLIEVGGGPVRYGMSGTPDQLAGVLTGADDLLTALGRGLQVQGTLAR